MAAVQRLNIARNGTATATRVHHGAQQCQRNLLCTETLHESPIVRTTSLSFLDIINLSEPLENKEAESTRTNYENIHSTASMPDANAEGVWHRVMWCIFGIESPSPHHEYGQRFRTKISSNASCFTAMFTGNAAHCLKHHQNGEVHRMRKKEYRRRLAGSRRVKMDRSQI